MGKLSQRVAVITGGARGIGKQIALTFAKEGADIVIGDVIEMGTVAEEIVGLGRKGVTIRADVSKKSDVKNLIDTAITTFKRVDILVNNAGTLRRATVLEMTEDDWDTVFNVNLKGVLWCTQAAAKYMAEQKYGKIINIASIAALGSTRPAWIAANYATSKAGVVRLTKSCSNELGPYGINVNAIAPGFIFTDITYIGRSPEEVKRFAEEQIKTTDLGRAGTPQDIANVALFLASEDSSFISGQVIAVDGGR
jgi:3-oxoacyl-[acyl-carrier protein] reductase